MSRRSRQVQPYTPGQVAAMFHVDVKTVSRWADSGRLECIKTPGGHRRFPVDAVERLIAEGSR